MALAETHVLDEFEDPIFADLAEQGFSLVAHTISPNQIDDVFGSYAEVSDNLPKPELTTLNAMIKDPEELDDLDYQADTQQEWHLYRTNTPHFAKPSGYTNRSLQIEALTAHGRNVTASGDVLLDDPKEFYHFDAHTLDRMIAHHEQHGWKLPQEVIDLHRNKLEPLHAAARLVVVDTLARLEVAYPELLKTVFTPEDIMSSAMRILIYHKGQGDVLAAGHYDKGGATFQFAESHLGLRVRNPKTGEMTEINRDSKYAAFFLAANFVFDHVYPNSPLRPGWHDVIKNPEAAKDRRVYGIDCERNALIFFVNSLFAGIPSSKLVTHTETSLPNPS